MPISTKNTDSKTIMRMTIGYHTILRVWIALAVLCIFTALLPAIAEGVTDAEITKQIVGQWREGGHIRVFYGDGSYFLDPEPEGRPLGKWSVHNKVLYIKWPAGAVRSKKEPIVK